MNGTEAYAQVPVHGRHLRYANAQLSQAGIPFGVQPGANNIYIIIVPASYAPMVQSAPWVYQPPPTMQRAPIVQVAVVALILVVAWFVFQAAPVMLASLAGDAAAEQSGNAASTGSNPLQAALDSVLAIQQVQESMFSAAVMACGVPLVALLVIVTGMLLLRIVMRSRR